VAAVIVRVVIQRHVVVRGIPRLVGIERVDPQEPLLPTAIALDKLAGGLEGARRGPLLLQPTIAVVAHILRIGKAQHALPIGARPTIVPVRAGIVSDVPVHLVAPLKVPAVEGIVKVVATVDQVRAIKGQLRGPTSAAHQLG